MKKLFVVLFVMVLLGVLGFVGVMYYVKPDLELDLSYEKVPVAQRALDMVKRQSLELILSEKDLNNLMKQSLADDPIVSKDIELTGAHFSLEKDLLVADYNVLWRNDIAAGLQVDYRLKWSNPNVVGYVEDVRLKGIPLPATAVEGFVIPIGDELPKPLKIEKIEWGEGQIKVKFKKPSLADLQDLLR